jgi:hypothetical protein
VQRFDDTGRNADVGGDAPFLGGKLDGVGARAAHPGKVEQGAGLIDHGDAHLDLMLPRPPAGKLPRSSGHQRMKGRICSRELRAKSRCTRSQACHLLQPLRMPLFGESEKKQGAAGITTAAPYIAGQWGRGDNRLQE